MTDFFQSRFAKASRFHWDFLKEYKDSERWERLAKNFSRLQLEAVRSEDNVKIPRVIHQIWLGPKPLPELYQLWGKSWLRHNPDFTYRLWRDHDIDNFGLKNRTLYDATDNYGARSDLARYEILHRLGGIYLDTDFECIAPIPESFLAFSFVACLMFNATPELSNGVLMAAPQSALLGEVIKACTMPERSTDMFGILNATGPFLLTRKYFESSGESLDSALVLPSDYFFPWPNFAMDFKGDPHCFITNQSIGIHHWQTSWFDKPRQGVRYHLKGVVKAMIHASQRWLSHANSLRLT